jgi:hypothetical protein
MVLRREHAGRAGCLGHAIDLNELGGDPCIAAKKLKRDWRSAITRIYLSRL